MALQGDLKNMPLADILQSLKANRQSGTLSVRDGKKELYLFFRKELILHVSPGLPSEQYLAPMLYARFGVTDEQLQRELAKRGKRSIAQQLAKARLADAKDVAQLHALYLCSYLFDTFAWKKGSFEFVDAAAAAEPFDADQLGVTLNMQVEPTVLESMRRLDEWKQVRKVVPTMDDVFVVSDMYKSQHMVQLNDAAQTVLARCDGEHSVAQIADTLGMDLLVVAQVIAHHVSANYLRLVRAEDYAALAERHVEGGDAAGALKLLKRSVETDGANMEVRALYAERCRAAGLLAEATSEYKTLAQLAREREDFARARAYYETLVEMNPSEHQMQQRLYEMLLEQDDDDAVAAGLALAATYQRLELRTERVELLRDMALNNAADVDVLEQLGEAELALERRAEGAAALAQAGRLCAEARQVARACGLYQKALEATPDDTRMAHMLADLRTGEFLARRARRRRMGLTVVAAVVVLLLAAYGGYNGWAGWAYLNLRNDNLRQLAAGEYAQARESIDGFGARCPWSLVLLDRVRYRTALDRLILSAEAAAQRAQAAVQAAAAPTDSLAAADTVQTPVPTQ